MGFTSCSFYRDETVLSYDVSTQLNLVTIRSGERCNVWSILLLQPLSTTKMLVVDRLVPIYDRRGWGGGSLHCRLWHQVEIEHVPPLWLKRRSRSCLLFSGSKTVLKPSRTYLRTISEALYSNFIATNSTIEWFRALSIWSGAMPMIIEKVTVSFDCSKLHPVLNNTFIVGVMYFYHRIMELR